ncbi:putative pantetheine hydrolase [Spinactinospora alkalitolerans]|uniref:Putative pantetheine hydrolase n=1 Tax=Spinactinospora alkalitolerans TaxID=687207 RepID=A0A852TY41_9ACTN|nr:P1 family peptidase [Spinactinospora alkalitolerans]NYE46934.1 putative pantetheine hydrolase [Spinactinospora alkalitolerans]
MSALPSGHVPVPGPTNDLTDVTGVRVGHRTAVGAGRLTGTTVVLAPPGGAVGGVDVRGGGPGTRETDLLDPRNAVERVNAVLLGGGSAFGLAAADGVMERLLAAGEGVRVGPGDAVIVPIVPGAVVFDLGRGGDPRARPTADFGSAAYDDAGTGPVRQGCVGAGTGALVGRIKGAVGSASAVLADGGTVAALAVVNAAGSAFDPDTGELYAARFALPGEFPGLGRPDPAEAAAFAARPAGPETTLHTTIGVVATDAALTKAQCAKAAGIAHDGLARAVRPVHTMLDGDTVFTLATGRRPAPDQQGFHDLLAAAGDCFTRAVAHAVLAATSVRTPAGAWPGYRDAFPSAFTSER